MLTAMAGSQVAGRTTLARRTRRLLLAALLLTKVDQEAGEARAPLRGSLPI